MARLRVVTPVPNAEVFIDGASAGPAPFDHNDLAPGKHFVIVRARGFAEWKREVDLDPAAADDAVGRAESARHGQDPVERRRRHRHGRRRRRRQDAARARQHRRPASTSSRSSSPATLDAKQPFHIDGGEQKILAADLAPLAPRPHARGDAAAHARHDVVLGASTIDPARFTADLAGGFVPFGQVRLTVGAFRWNWVGMDAGIELRTIGYFTEGGAHAKLQFMQAGPVAIGVNMFLGGGGGAGHRNDFIFELGVPFTLLFGDIVRFTAHPYLQVYSDKNCPTYDDIRPTGLAGQGRATRAPTSEQSACDARDGKTGANGALLPVPTRRRRRCRRIRATASSAAASCCRRCSRSR